MRVHLTRKSTNKKTGPIPVTTSSSSTCPNACPFSGKGCYADHGPLKIHWRKVDAKERGHTYKEFLKVIKSLPEGQVWRHNQAGDLPHKKQIIDASKLKALIDANKGKKGFTYTHHIVEGNSNVAKENRSIIRRSNRTEFTINLSSNNIKHADTLVKLHVGPVTTLLHSNEVRKKFKSPDGNTILTCPAAYKDNFTCESCILCRTVDRKTIIGFPAHGSRRTTIDKTL